MSIGQSLLPEFDAEMANTRKLLERVPDDKLPWRAHPKSNTLGWVAKHVAEIPGWPVFTLNQSELDLNPPGGKPYASTPPASRQEILELFDKSVAAGRQALAEARDEQFAEPWTLKSGGRTMFTMPKGAVIRSFVMNHLIHHRAHLSAYCRMNDIPVPGMYGPSGDE
jgi:uncharacterized damage-inducible protein DinB